MMLEQRMEKMPQVCLKKNMKLNPDKVQLGRRVEFGGVSIEACKTRGDDQKRVYLSPREEKLQTFLDLKTPESKDLQWKTTFGGRQPSLEDDLRWKMTFNGRQPLVEDDLRWKTTFGGDSSL